MTTNIYDLAHNLERAIRTLPEYEEVLEAKEAIAKDDATRTLWEEFSQMQMAIQDIVQAGELPSQEEQEQMQALIGRIEANPSLKNYFDQQQRLYICVADLEKIIFSPIRELGQ